MRINYHTENEIRDVSAGQTAAWRYGVEIPSGSWEMTPTTINHQPCDPAEAYYWRATVPGIIRTVSGLPDRGQAGSYHPVHVTYYNHEVRMKLADVDANVSFGVAQRNEIRSEGSFGLAPSSYALGEEIGTHWMPFPEALEGRNVAAAIAYVKEACLPWAAAERGLQVEDLRAEYRFNKAQG